MMIERVCRIPTAVLLLVASFYGSFCSGQQTAPFAVETLMNNLNFYGPLYHGDGGWGPHQMTLIEDYTWQIQVELEVDSFFLLVNMNGQTPDWKSCKLGRGLDASALEIGGGNIPVYARGSYTLTYFTPSFGQSGRPSSFPNAKPSGFIMAGTNLWPAAIVNTTKFVTEDNPIQINLYFSAPVDATLVQANFSAITLGNAVAVSTGFTVHSNSWFSFLVTPSEDPSEFIVRVAVPEGLSTSAAENGRPNTPAWWSVIYSPLSSRKGVASWERLTLLRDTGNRWPVNKPEGGWWVTAIHGNMVAPSGHVLLTGWGRSQEFACTSQGARKQGVSFLLDPATITNQPIGPQNVTLEVVTMDEAARKPIDVLYCSGHAPLRDGRKLYAGGAFYANLSTDAEKETGIPYARMFDPLTLNFTRVLPDMPIGTAWYPTNSRLEDGRVLIAGGFLAFTCYGQAVCTNPALTLFNTTRYDLGMDPWEWYLPANMSTHDIDPGGKDYTRIWQLTQPIFVGGYKRTVAMMGYRGITLLVNLDPQTPYEDRFYRPINGVRPNGGNAGCNADSTSLILHTGEFLSMGGCGSPWIDIYDPYEDSWRSVNSGIPRNTGSSLLLPDGNVLLINGENGSVDQSAALNLGITQQGDPRYPQILNPETLEIWTVTEQEDDGQNNLPPFRGYHNMVALLKDGRILISGGVHQRGDIGCEQPNLRIWNPPYLNPTTGSNVRPVWDKETMLSLNQSTFPNGEPQFLNGTIEPFFMRPNGTITVSFTQGPLKYKSSSKTDLYALGTQGVVLMALQAFTHSYDQNQRFIPLDYLSVEDNFTATVQTEGTITLKLPPSPMALPGEYFMFLLSASGVPSDGLHVRLLSPEENATSAYVYPSSAGASGGWNPPGPPSPDPYVPTQPDTHGTGIWSTQNILLIAILGGGGVCFFVALAFWFLRKQRQEDQKEDQQQQDTDTQLHQAASTGARKFNQL